ncbi:hypothetical protein LTR84_007254 [Exophiala bonariae]|uniref:Uncharacterized protein n=1 Tax=Exophiala bonariae TaxID=1690606 RepID=A0AAV9MZ73_9EURO|nr:hypothetical protein LTR84_007254 [Exophiala bonariae]
MQARVAPFYAMKHWVSGDNLWVMKELHEKHGPVVRIAPNQLSFCTSSSWKDIHGHKAGRKQFLKGTWYEPFPSDPHQIVSVSDPDRHAAMRKALSHGFSAGALASQEDRVHHYLDMMLKQISSRYTDKPADMTKWYNYLTFDVIGELAFGESFGCVEFGKPHYWIEILFGFIKNTNFVRSFEYFPLLRSLLRIALRLKLLPRRVYELRAKMARYGSEKLAIRLANPPARVDFLHRMISQRDDWTGSALEELQTQASLLTVAGSETTATALSGITYYLCRDQRVYNKLISEIRSRFSTLDEISGRATEQLPYLKAVIDEGLRLYPAIAAGLPRVSPGEVVDGHFIPKGTIVNVNPWVAGHIESNFRNAFEFIPERWLDPDCKDDKAASQPFLTGSRVCLGRHLAMLELRIVLAKILWKFDMKLMDDNLDWVKSNKNYVFWEKPSLPVQFSPVQRASLSELPPVHIEGSSAT